MDIMRNYLIFGDIDSRDYDIEVFFSDIDRTPKRVYTRLNVAGRNGAFVIDEGRYEDVPVTYGCIALNDEDRQAFVNALASQIGYFRLEDNFNAEEFYSAVFEGDIDPHLTPERDKSSFNISFTRKPQRWLVDGETVVTVGDGDVLTNPTLFKSSPFLEADGYGHIQIGEYNISIEDVVVGRINVSDKITVQNQALVRTWNINEAQYNQGDHVTVNGLSLKTVFTITTAATFFDWEPTGDRTMGIEYYNTTDNDATLSYSKSGKTANFGVVVPPIELTIGQNLTKSYSMRATINVQNNTDWQSQRMYFGITFKYTNGTLTVDADYLLFNRNNDLSIASPRETCIIQLGSISGDSSLSILEGSVYIDCDIGDAYQIKDGQYVSLNEKVELGSDLPKLESGTNVIAMDDTITSLKVTPRWWRV